MDKRLNGQVKFFNIRKGWGLIDGENGQTYFVHHTNITSNDPYKILRDGEKVTFVDSGKRKEYLNPVADKVKSNSVQTVEVKDGTEKE